jgi:hypothetical protein
MALIPAATRCRADTWSESANGKNNALSEDNAAKPSKTVGCRLFRGRFNKGWTETTGAVIRSGPFAKPFAKISTINIVISMAYGEWCNGSTTAFGLSR